MVSTTLVVAGLAGVEGHDEFSREEKSHVMGRVPDVDQLLGLIFLLESKKGSCTGCVPAFGPNGVGWSQKSWTSRSSTGREPLSL
jgi:hypothetical protein